MSQLTPVFLTIHILTAIGAFGPSFVFPLIARMAAQSPQNSLFALKLTESIEKRIVLPAAVTMPISGLLLVWSEGIDLLAAHWLLLAIALFTLAIAFSLAVQVPILNRMVELVEAISPDRAVRAPAASASVTPPSTNPAFAAGPGAALARASEDPRAELARLGRRSAGGGMLLTLLVIVIVSLMAWKPGF